MDVQARALCYLRSRRRVTFASKSKNGASRPASAKRSPGAQGCGDRASLVAGPPICVMKWVGHDVPVGSALKLG